MFTATAGHYDALYSIKDYEGEAARIIALIDRHAPQARSLLDVACATGNHLRAFARRFEVEGIDLDEGLLAVAREKLPGVRLSCADMTDFDLGRTFDVVTCLYGSVAYVKTLPRLRLAMARMTRHLAPGGILLIEPWWTRERYAPGVQVRHVDHPQVKIARMSTGRVEGALVRLEIHYLVGENGRVEHRMEQHEIGLFTQDEYLEAMRAPGLRVDFEPSLGDRGTFVARR